jgi:hypothetical protein
LGRSDGPPVEAVSIPSDCERVLAPVAEVEPTLNADFRALYVRQRMAARTANARIVSGRGCVAKVRESYAGK